MAALLAEAEAFTEFRVHSHEVAEMEERRIAPGPELRRQVRYRASTNAHASRRESATSHGEILSCKEAE